jgi:ATP-dependent Zn protease
VARAHERARQLLGEKKATLERLARRLLEQEVLEGAELQALLTSELLTPAALSLG